MESRAARLLGLMLCASPFACDRTTTVSRAVNVHEPASCVLPPMTDGIYKATGDFPTPTTSNLNTVGASNVVIDNVPADVKSLALLANPPDNSNWRAVTLVPPSGNFDMLLLPTSRVCALAPELVFQPGMVFGLVDSQTILTVAPTSTETLQSFVVDLTRGAVSRMTVGLEHPRTNASVSPFGTAGRALIAGGLSVEILQNTAEVYDPIVGDITQTITLSEARSDHGAVVLASGDVLLVGGSGTSGPLASIDRIGASSATAAELPITLATPRTKPSVLTLADGTIMVGGGIESDGSFAQGVEFFSADASRALSTAQVPVRTRSAFVALDGGDALFVAAPDVADPPGFQGVWLVSPIFGALPLSVTLTLTDVKLFPTGGGGALLWTGASWLAFDPWKQNFALPSVSPPTGPNLDSPFVAPDPGLRAWVDDDGNIDLWRDDSVRNAFATEGPYLSADTTFMSPETSALTMLTFDPQVGLTLGSDDAAFVSDARYLDVTVDVDAASIGVPQIVIRTQSGDAFVGGAACPYPTSIALPAHVHVERTGAAVAFRIGTTGALSPCAGVTLEPSERIAVGVHGGSAGATAHDLQVVRVAPAGPQPQ